MKHLSDKNRLNDFEDLFYRASKIYLAVSYIRDSGVKIIRPFHRNKKKSIKILLDTQMNLSEKIALRNLLHDGAELKSYKGRFNYHPKLFLFCIENEWQAIIGSMNLTRGGLSENTEYGLLICGDEALKSKQWFDEYWGKRESKKIDNNFIESLPEITYISKEDVLHELKNKASAADKEKEINDFISCWTQDTEKHGQTMRKNGWRVRPAHGEIDDELLRKFKKILLKDMPIKLTEEFCREAMQTHLPPKRSELKTTYRDWFIRFPVNYMKKLNLIDNEDGIIRLTSTGKAFISADDRDLKDFVIRAFSLYEWFGVPIKDYLFEIFSYTENTLSKREMLLFVRHAGVKDYCCWEAKDIAGLILAYRKLDKDTQDKIYKEAEDKFCQRDASKSRSSWSNMAGNALSDLMQDFSVFEEVSYKKPDQGGNSSLQFIEKSKPTKSE